MPMITRNEAPDKIAEAVRSSLQKASQDEWVWDVFISYRTAETADLADKVYEVLTNSKHPITKKPLRVFLDCKSIAPGQNINKTVMEALTASHSFVLLFSKKYATTEYTTFEQLAINAMDPASVKQRLIPVKAMRCRIPDRFKDVKCLELEEKRHWRWAFVLGTLLLVAAFVYFYLAHFDDFPHPDKRIQVYAVRMIGDDNNKSLSRLQVKVIPSGKQNVSFVKIEATGIKDGVERVATTWSFPPSKAEFHQDGTQTATIAWVEEAIDKFTHVDVDLSLDGATVQWSADYNVEDNCLFKLIEKNVQ